MGSLSSTPLSPNDVLELTKSTKFTTEEIKEWYREFTKDFPSGYLTKEDFMLIYHGVFPGGNATAFADSAFQMFDRNKDGKIDFREFMIGLSVSSRGSFEEKMKWIFTLYDTNDNGFISKDEMLVIIEAIHVMYREKDSDLTAQQHVDKVYKEGDANSDGQLSFDEFFAICKSNPKLSCILTGDMMEERE